MTLQQMEQRVRLLTHAELARQLEAADWDRILHSDPILVSAAALKAAVIRRELSKRRRHAEVSRLDPHVLDTFQALA